MHLFDVTLVNDELAGILPMRMSMHLFDVTLVNDELAGILPVRMSMHLFSDELVSMYSVMTCRHPPREDAQAFIRCNTSQ